MASSRFFGWIYRHHRLFPLTSDLAAWLVAAIAAWLLLADGSAQPAMLATAAALAMAVQALVGWANGLYRARWRVTSFAEVTAALWSWLPAAAAAGLMGLLGDTGTLGVASMLLWAAGAFALMIISRLAWRNHWEQNHRPHPDGRRRTLIFGAGEGGRQVIRTMLADSSSGYYPVALLDDDPKKRNREIDGVRVEGQRIDVAEVAKRHRADALLIAVVDASNEVVQDLHQRAARIGIEVLVLPPSTELVDGMKLSEARPPSIEDLLGREPVEIDLGSVTDYISGKRVLVTGAGGSIGSEIVRQVAGLEPDTIFMLDRDESALHGLQLSMEGHALLDDERLIVADIRDRERMFSIFFDRRPEVVFHAAALKHLTLLEHHPSEALKTNVLGTANVLDAAMAVGVDRFVNLSTDKAAAPTSALGASKRTAEVLTAMSARSTARPYVSVRFGNVLGSRGSVLPTMVEQLRQGAPVTVTDREVTRFFMTIPEAVKLVLQAGAFGTEGEVMILDMGEPVKILDLAERLVASLDPSAEIIFTGLRPGEKLHEVVLSPDEISTVRSHPRIHHAPVTTEQPYECLALLGDGAVAECRSLLAKTSFASVCDVLPDPLIDRAG